MPASQAGESRVVERRPRGMCSVCQQDVALSPKTGLVGAHGRGGRCSGTKKKPAIEPSSEAELAELPQVDGLLLRLERELRASADLAAQIRAHLGGSQRTRLDRVSMAALHRALEARPTIPHRT